MAPILEKVPPQITENAHFKRYLYFKENGGVENVSALSFTIVGGDPKQSVLFDMPLPITDYVGGPSPFQLKRELAVVWNLWGRNGEPLKMLKKVPHWITGANEIQHLRHFLGT
jgi:hypothetical protein